MQNNDTLRVGVVGTGWAGETLIKGFAQQTGVQVTAIADSRPLRLEELRARYNIPYVYEEYNELIARDDLDIVVVATPNYLHAPVAIAALQNGKHVLCEKPMALTTAEAESMVQAAQKANRALMVAYSQRRFNDVETLKKYVDEGKLGRIYHAKASWMRRQGIPGMGGWFTTKAMSGGGPLIDLGIHVLDMALYMMCEPEPVTVSAATYAEQGPKGKGSRGDASGTGYDVEDLATAFIRMKDGATLLLEASWAVYGRYSDDFGIALYGTDGGAEIDIRRYNREDSVTIFTDVAGVPAVLRPSVKGGDGHAGVVREFIQAIRSGDWSAHQGQEGLLRSRILDACYRSAQEGREVQL